MSEKEQESPPTDNTSFTDSQSGKKKRSPVERAVVWSLIVVALMVVLLESNARYGYSKTLEKMQNRITLAEKEKGKEFLLIDAREMVKGFPYGDERLTENGKQIQYRWFSLFRTFAIELSTGMDDVVLSLETDVDAFGEDKPPVKDSVVALPKLNLPEKGLSPEYNNLPVLAASQFDSQLGDLKGLLSREIVRQAVLISAREGLGLPTRDFSLRGEVTLIENPQTFPLQLYTRIDGTGKVDFKIERSFRDKPAAYWESDTIQLTRDSLLESLIEQSELLSRTIFVEAMKTAGYTGKAPEWKTESSIPEKTLRQLNEWNFISQYTVIQDMHAAIRTEGESPERLAVLTRAYANLGHLTEIHWSPAHKVFKARSLLYAERLKARTDNSTWALAHRAYARTFTGLHLSALADIETIKSAKKTNAENQRPLPNWINLIDAYCSYKPKVLEQAVGQEDLKSMAVYLRSLQIDPISNEKELVSRTEQLLKLEPACCRALDQLCETQSLGTLRNITEIRQNQIWEPMYERLQAGNLPDTVKEPLNEHMEWLFKLKTGLPFRKHIIELLKNVAVTQHEPSVNGLGQLFQEVYFTQTCRKLEFQTDYLSVSVDNVVSEARPLLKDHPYEAFIESYSSVSKDATAAYQRLLSTFNPHELELLSEPLITNSYYKLNRDDYTRFFLAAQSNMDPVFQDQLNYQRFVVKQGNYSRNLIGEIAERLLKISPYVPQTVAMNLDANNNYIENHHAEVMERYGDDPEILSALGKRFLKNNNDEKAEETFKRRLDIAPDHTTYTSLADLYQTRGDMDKWKETLQKALRVPTSGLQNYQIHNKLAYYYMQRGDFELAKPHAEKAAESYSSWGLECGARCSEGLGDMDQAEALMKARSMRYDGNAADWYFWCVRTGYGDLDTARQLAERMILENLNPNHYTRAMEAGIIHLIQGSKPEAFKLFLTTFQKHHDAFSGLHAAVLADELGFTQQRDELLNETAELWSKDYATAEIANYFQRMLLNQDPVDWNSKWFESLIMQLPDGSPTNFDYFVGKFLEKRGRDKLAVEYLQLAATSPNTNKYNCILASQDLRSHNRVINSRRIRELEDSYDEVKVLATQASYLLQTKKQKEAIIKFSKILKLKPELVCILINRAQTYEAMHNYTAAIADYKQAIELDPEYWLPYNNLAFLYAASEQEEFRDGRKSLENAQLASERLPTQYWVNYAAFAVAYAELKQFDNAIEMQTIALERAPDEAKKIAQRRLRLFNEGEPYRRTPENK